MWPCPVSACCSNNHPIVESLPLHFNKEVQSATNQTVRAFIIPYFACETYIEAHEAN